MHRNHRVVNNGEFFHIHKVYYKDNGEIDGWTENPVSPAGETLEELKADMEMFKAALNKPVLKLTKRTETK